MQFKKVVPSIIVLALLSGCSHMGHKESQGTVIGSVVGAAAGSFLGHGSGHYLGAAAGAVVGGLVGNRIGADMDEHE